MPRPVLLDSFRAALPHRDSFDPGEPELGSITLCQIPAKPDGPHAYALN
jgi:hypothetical protein